MKNLKESTDDGDGHEAPFEIRYEPHQEYHLDENGNLIYNQIEPEDNKRTLYQHMIINCNND